MARELRLAWRGVRVLRGTPGPFTLTMLRVARGMLEDCMETEHGAAKTEGESAQAT
jgi:hypothetical protein